MNGGEPERPLEHLNGVESALALERLRGEMWQQVTRIDGTLAAQANDIDRTEKFNDRALELAQTGLDKHLATLNDHAAKMLAAHEKSQRDILEAQAKLQSKEMAERDKKEIDSEFRKLDERLTEAEKREQNLRGRLWAPMAAAGAIVLAVGVAIGKLILR